MTIDEIKKWMLESSGFPVTQANAEYLERFQAIAFQAGAASRDAEFARLRAINSKLCEKSNWYVIHTARLEEERDQLRAHINDLREAMGLLEKYVAYNGDTWVQKEARNALSITPEQSLAEYRDKVIEECAVKADALANCEENTDGYRNGAAWCAEAIRAMKEQL